MIDLTGIYLFLLALVRITAFFVTAPFFSSKGVPAMFKLGLGLFTALVLLPTIRLGEEQLILNGTYFYYLIQETIIGLVLGWIAQIIFTSIHVAGSFIDMQIGFAIANVIDPQTGVQSPLIGNFKYTFAILLLLALNWHHLFIDGIVSSYYLLPITGDWINQMNHESVITFVIGLFTTMFVIAFKMAAPIIGTLFVSDVILGIIARTVPQLNVFVVGLPLKVSLNFILFLLLAPLFIFIFREIFEEMLISMKQFIDLMGLS